MSELFGTAEQLDLEAIEARCSKATPGPWRNTWKDCKHYMSSWFIDRDEDDIGVGLCAFDINQINAELYATDDDAEFIAHAREDVPALLARVRELERTNHLFCECVLRAENAWRTAHPDDDTFPDGADALVQYIESLEVDARVGRAVRGMDGDSLLLNDSSGSMKHWQRYTDAKVEWMYDERYQIFAFLVGAGAIKEDGYPDDDVWHSTPEQALGLEEGSEDE